MNRLLIGIEWRPVEQTGGLYKSPQIIKSYWTIYLHQRPLDDVLQLPRAYRAGPGKAKEMTPCLGRKTAPFMGPEHSKRH